MPRDSHGTTRRTTQELRAKIVELAEKGLTDEEIAELVDRSVSTVHQTTRWLPQPGD